MRKIFWEDPYLTRVEVLLDQTIIYSFAGGQQSDDGTVEGIPVADSEILGGDGSIVYSLKASPSFGPGDSVTCEIDWKKRFQIMKLHSATHIAMAILYDMKGPLPVIGANVTSDKGRVDFRSDEPLTHLVSEMQQRANDIIQQDLEIITTADEASSRTESRIWAIQALGQNWLIPCGGTHPKRTGEIEEIKLKRKNLGAGKERLEIVLTSIR